MEIQFQQQPDSYQFTMIPPLPDNARKISKFRGRNKKTSSRSSKNCKYVGVRQRPSGRWVAEIKDTTQKIRMWLGTFETAEDAALAYDEAACLLRGSNTRTNFAITPNFVSHDSPLASRIKNLLSNRKSAASNGKNTTRNAIRPTPTTSTNSTNDSSSQNGSCISNDNNHNKSSSSGSGGNDICSPVFVDQKGQRVHWFGDEYNSDLGNCISSISTDKNYSSSIGTNNNTFSLSKSSRGGGFLDQKAHHPHFSGCSVYSKPGLSSNYSGSTIEEKLETISRGGIEFLIQKGEEDWHLFDNSYRPDLSSCTSTHEEGLETSCEGDRSIDFSDQKGQDSHFFDNAYKPDLSSCIGTHEEGLETSCEVDRSIGFADQKGKDSCFFYDAYKPRVSHCSSKYQSSLSTWGIQLHQVLLQQQQGSLDNHDWFEMPVGSSGDEEMQISEFERMKVERQISASLYAMNGVQEYMETIVCDPTMEGLLDLPPLCSLFC